MAPIQKPNMTQNNFNQIHNNNIAQRTRKSLDQNFSKPEFSSLSSNIMRVSGENEKLSYGQVKSVHN